MISQLLAYKQYFSKDQWTIIFKPESGKSYEVLIWIIIWV
jgi:hypothetical protein